jgi:Glycosyltransferase family 92
MKSLYFKAREIVRFSPLVAGGVYMAQSLRYSNHGEFRRRVLEAARKAGSGKGIALCCRIRDEALYLDEFIAYYLAAGVDHFFFYEKLSRDHYREVLAPWTAAGIATLFDNWPHVPVSPSAEEDCVLRSIGRFEWIGFIDADEFVVIGDGRGIGEFLAEYPEYPAVALHWYMYGSNGHERRPEGPVIAEYTRREQDPNRHVKCFVRPQWVARYRNSHSWYYRGMRCAVNESRKSVRSSFALPPTAIQAWINHYHHKSDQDYFEKAARKSVLDKVGMSFEIRSAQRHTDGEKKANAVADECAVEYYLERCRRLSTEPVLMNRVASAIGRRA